MNVRHALFWLLLGTFSAAGTFGAAMALAQPAYRSLPPDKALAVSPSRPDTVVGVAYGEASELVASVQAQERCQAAADPGEVCELVRLNDQHVTTGAEILAQVPRGPHPLFLWRYQRGATVVYLAGSIHILKETLYPLPAPLVQAFDGSDYLVLEVDVSSQSQEEILRRTRAHAELPAGQTLADVLPAPLYERLGRHLANFGLDASMLRRAKPAMAMNHIVVSRLLTLGYLPDSGLESYFSARRTAGQRSLQIETLEAQLELLFDQPMATQVQLLAETLEMEREIEPMLADMLVAWLSGDDVEFLEQFKAQSGDSPESRAFLRQLLDERNVTMADAIAGYLNAPDETPRSYFVLVGAAHLVGPRGIVELLADDGIEGQRVMSTDRLGADGDGSP